MANSISATFRHTLISGIGDYLMALNKALHLIDYLGASYIHSPSSIHERVGFAQVEDMLGLSSFANSEASSAGRFDANTYSMTELCSLVLNGVDTINHDFAVEFRPTDYGYKWVDLMTVGLDLNSIHPSLRTAVRSSALLESSMNIRQEIGNRKLCVVHVRRGDIALVDVAQLKKSFMGLDIDYDYFYVHSRQFLNLSDLESSELPHFYRYFDATCYLNALSHYKQLNNDCYCILVSDGFSSAARILSTHTGKSEAELEQVLEKDLDCIRKMCNRSIIGESRSCLELTLSCLIAADSIIHGPSCFPLTIKYIAGYPDYYSLTNVATILE